MIAGLLLGYGAGCAAQAQTGTVGWAGVGVLMGQIIGKNTASTLIGAGIGTRPGHIKGNEMDKSDAMKRQQLTSSFDFAWDSALRAADMTGIRITSANK